MSPLYDMIEGDEYPPGIFRFGRIMGWNQDTVEYYVGLRFWPRRLLFVAISTSGLYRRSGRAIRYDSGHGLHQISVNVQFHLRWNVARLRK